MAARSPSRRTGPTQAAPSRTVPIPIGFTACRAAGSKTGSSGASACGTCPVGVMISTAGCAYAYVGPGTGIIKVVRSYSGVRAGDQGTGGPAGFFPGKRVYLTGALAAALDRHEAGHILAAKKIYDHTIRLAEQAANHAK